MKQYLIATLVGLRGVCFQVNAETSKAFQRAFFEHCDLDPDNAQEVWQVGFIDITSDGKIGFSCRPNYDNEQVILAPEKFNNQKDLMQFLVMGGEVINDDCEVNYFDDDGNLVSDFYGDWKPRIDKLKPKRFLAWVSDSPEPSRERGSLTFVHILKSGFLTYGGCPFKYATPLTDTELAEFGLKRIEND